MAYRALEKLINLHDGYRGVFRHDNVELLLLQEDGEVRLIDRHCPHAGQPLDSAAVTGAVITCPRHQICFSLADGRAGNANCPALGVHTVVYEGNSLGIDG
jgi:nitrite reductase/ring-hydroxylating ferredoxin subunit